MTVFRLNIFLAIMLLAGQAMAVPASQKQPSSFFSDHAQGWFWYDDPAERRKSEKAIRYPFPPKDIKEARRQLKELAERAVMHPTDENLVAYIRLQNWVNDKAEAFSRSWKRVLWSHPELDYSVRHPVNSQGLLLQRDIEAERDRARLLAIARRYGMIFVFRSNCPYCHAEGPMLKRFSRQFGFSVVPVSQDGLGLPDWPSPKPDIGVSAQFRVRAVPALFLVNPRRREVFPVAYGLISEAELKRRILEIVRFKEQGVLQ